MYGSSVAHCSRSQDIDLFKFQLSYCYNPPQDTCPITSAVLGHLVRTHVPLIFLLRDKKSYWLSEKCATLWIYQIVTGVTSVAVVPSTHLVTRGQFLAFGYCRCLCVFVYVCVSVHQEFVRAITHQPFKLGSPNLDQRCKRPWLRALLFCGMIDRDLQGQIELQSQNLPNSQLVHAITHHQLKLQFLNLEQKCILALFRSLPILGLIEIDLQFNF